MHISPQPARVAVHVAHQESRAPHTDVPDTRRQPKATTSPKVSALRAIGGVEASSRQRACLPSFSVTLPPRAEQAEVLGARVRSERRPQRQRSL
ncbi:hypothetical protein OH76DRAFT_1405513 [Lentinus brumalis]|uniref:Uncharacterized protein n=1 Tax=Lentinus brumalis TaxID=2498619 RepID=A0A371D584_9APHY|nr:hypothetical protein OH76DRAFT_1405513 [Polyporus brumalis]